MEQLRESIETSNIPQLTQILSTTTLPTHWESIQDDLDQTVISLAAATSQDILLILLKHIPKPSILNFREEGRTMLHICVEENCIQAYHEIIKLCPALINEPDTEGALPIHYAAMQGQTAFIETSQKDVIDCKDHRGWTPLFYAGILMLFKLILASQNRVDAVKLLISKGAFEGWVDTKGKTALDYAKARSYYDTIDLLTT